MKQRNLIFIFLLFALFLFSIPINDTKKIDYGKLLTYNSAKYKATVITSKKTNVEYIVDYSPSYTTGKLISKISVSSYKNSVGKTATSTELYNAKISCSGTYDSINLSNKAYAGFPRVTDYKRIITIEGMESDVICTINLDKEEEDTKKGFVVSVTILNGSDGDYNSYYEKRTESEEPSLYKEKFYRLNLGGEHFLDDVDSKDERGYIDSSTLSCSGKFSSTSFFNLGEDINLDVIGVKSDVKCTVKLSSKNTAEVPMGKPKVIFTGANGAKLVTEKEELDMRQGPFDVQRWGIRVGIKSLYFADGKKAKLDTATVECNITPDGVLKTSNYRNNIRIIELIPQENTSYFEAYCTVNPIDVDETAAENNIQITINITNGSYRGIGDSKQRKYSVDPNSTSKRQVETVPESDSYIANEGTVVCDKSTKITYIGGNLTIISKDTSDNCKLTLKENDQSTYKLKITVKNGLPELYEIDNIKHGDSFGIAPYFQANKGYQAEDAILTCNKNGNSQANDKGYKSFKIIKNSVERAVNVAFEKITSDLECTLEFIKNDKAGKFSLNFIIKNGTVDNKKEFSMKPLADKETVYNVIPDTGYKTKTTNYQCPEIVEYDQTTGKTVVKGKLSKDENCLIELMVDPDSSSEPPEPDDPGDETDEKTCFNGKDSLYYYYKLEMKQDEFVEKCCPLKSAVNEMTKEDYLNICATCFDGERSILNQYKKDPAANAIDLANCCSKDNAEESMGSKIYGEVCDKCFEGPDSLKEKYAEKPDVYVDKYRGCCKKEDALINMGSIVYNRICQTDSSKLECNSLVKNSICQAEADDGYIYEANEKGITANNLSCLINGSNEQNITFEESDYKNNKYCSVYCKEDIEYYFPGYGYNVKSNYAIPSGGQFSFKPYQKEEKYLENLPLIEQTKTCIYVIDNKALAKDLYGQDNISKIDLKKINNGLYKDALDILEQYHSVPEDSKEKTDLEKEYKKIVTKINSALGEFNSCLNYENIYTEKDLPEISNFHYSDMTLDNGINQKIFDNIKLVVKEMELIPTTEKKYCTSDLDCTGSTLKVEVPSLKLELSSSIDNLTDFVNAQMSTHFFETYDLAKNETKIVLSYGPNVELYTIKPNGIVVLKEELPQVVKNNNQYNYLGNAFPTNIRTRAGKYSYSFEISRVGIENRLLETYIKNNSSNKYECNYFIKNEILCSKNYCYTIGCLDDGTCELLTPGLIDDPTSAILSRKIDLNNIKLDHRELGRNWSDEKGVQTIERIAKDGKEIYLKPAMYSITLSGKEIREIRNYNKTNSYSDFNFTCNKDGNHCLSEFLTKFNSPSVNEARLNWLEYSEETKQFVNNK